MKRIYHPFNLWEDHKAGFYNNCSGDIKKQNLQKVVEFFNDSNLTYQFMDKVMNEWKFSVEHNMTNESMNRVAYLGQSAVCLCYGVPSTVTMEAWSLLDKQTQDTANSIANTILKKYGLRE